MSTVFEKVRGSRICLTLVLMLTCSGVAWCGEIHEAVKSNDSAKVRALIRSNPDLVFSKNDDGFTPLHLAAANGNKGLVEFLLTSKAEVNSKDNAASTPLYQATAGQHIDIVELLLAHKADVNAADEHGLTPLHYATLADNQDVVKTLLNHGANANVKDNKHGNTPLIIAVAKGNKEVTQLLLARGADVNLADNEGTPLAWALQTDHADIAELLRQHGGHE